MGIDNSDYLFDQINEANKPKHLPVDDEMMKTALGAMGVPIKKTRIYGNEDCPCGSGNRYDLCCSPNRLE